MHGYTKADFYGLYRASPIDPVSHRRYVEIKLHYHPAIRKTKGYRGKKVAQLVEKYNIQATDTVLVIGCAFGWLCEDLIAATGCTSLGTEISQYVHDNKGLSADDELIDAIEASRKCDNTYKSGIGKEIYDKFKDSSPRSTVTILDTACDTRAACQLVLDIATPTLIVTEEMWQMLDSKENLDMNKSLAVFNCPIAHIIDWQLV